MHDKFCKEVRLRKNKIEILNRKLKWERWQSIIRRDEAYKVQSTYTRAICLVIKCELIPKVNS